MKNNTINIKEKIALLETVDEVIKMVESYRNCYTNEDNTPCDEPYSKARYNGYTTIIAHLYELAK